jgi:hypothetical protein
MYRSDPLKLRGLLARLWAVLPPVLLGVLACWAVTGSAMLAVSNVRWLAQSDLAQSYLGWAFFRGAPWSLPLGANPSYGLEFASSVYYSDSIPLLAILIKPFAGWLPEPFQYFGGWVLICFVLQAFFAWRLLGLFTQARLARLLGATLFVLAPPMLSRLGGHMALVGHWCVLAALYLYMRPSRRWQTGCWATLVAMAMTIHAYLFVMVAAVWVADWLRRMLQDRNACAGVDRSWRWRAIREAVLVPMAAILAGWLAGFFMVSNGGAQAAGFGYYKMNLLAPFDGAGWSWFGLQTAHAAGEYEGFNYLGLGGLALTGLALLLSLKVQRLATTRHRWWPLVWVAVGLTVAAITPHVGWGSHQWQIPLPASWENKLSHLSLQSTGRLFWVPYYLCLIWALGVLSRVLPVRWLSAVLALGVALQLVDLYPGLASLHANLVTRAEATPIPGLHGEFWDKAATRYHRLRQLPLQITKPGWEALAFYAQQHGMGTDAVQLARVNWDRFNLAQDEQRSRLLRGQPENDSLYVLDDTYVVLARSALQNHGDALFRLDGRNVLAPGWAAPLPAGAVDLRNGTSADFIVPPFKTDFAAASRARLLLGEGWYMGDSISTSGTTASLFLPVAVDTSAPQLLTLTMHRMGKGAAAAQLELWLGGQRIRSCIVADGGCDTLQLSIPPVSARHFQELTLKAGAEQGGPRKLRMTLDRMELGDGR